MWSPTEAGSSTSVAKTTLPVPGESSAMAASATSAAIAARRRSWLTLQTSMTWGGRGWRRWDTRADYVDASVPRVRRIIGDHRPLDSPGCAVVRRHFEYVGILRGIAASPQ